MQKLYIPVLAGTTRERRKSIYAAQFVAEVGNTFDEVEAELIDPKDFNFPGDGNDPEAKDSNYTELTKRADGFFIVTPEYNHSFPGSLKRMLDSELKNYIHKPVVLAGVSSGRWGGVRAIEHLSIVTRELGLVNSFADLQFPNIGDVFNEDGVLQDDTYTERAEKSWRELIWLAKVLKHGRDNIEA